MKLFWNVALAFWAVLLPSMPIFAETPNVDSLLAAPNAPDVIDGMQPELRMATILQLARQMAERPEKLDIPKLLCAIRPWTTGDSSTDQEIQRSAWAEMATLDPQGPRYRWLDCVAVNIKGGYRATSLSPLYDLRQSYCTGVPIAKDLSGYLSELGDGIEMFNETVRHGMKQAVEQKGSSPRYSYYPLRNEIRLSTVAAARAVALAQAEDMSTARAVFLAAADRLKYVLENMDYINTRNGWAYHSDLQMHRALYDWLGQGSGLIDMDGLKNWPSALSDPAIAGAIPNDTRKRMEQGGDTAYVDPVFVERLLPGAARVNAECDRWRRRSFNTRELAEQIETCANKFGQPPSNAEELSNLDLCISEYQAHDWRVQFSSVRPDRVDEAVQNARVLVKKLMSTTKYQSLSVEQQNRIAENLNTVSEESYSARYSRIVTEHELQTQDRTALEQIFDDLKLSNRPLMAREPIY
ncbi:hypothetical protein KL867_05195 [Ruegeria litorea]|uniref:Uncharacterized protein n=1 Tax=Falsiruegeria litorea TaxID=1280831 RepID=A0ABS5WMS6_9RHOB|nr:hypothetical protein [Falsiruegeria litorea]MBT3140435.1 hypothetical protein [Falsiruegeria litorea]